MNSVVRKKILNIQNLLNHFDPVVAYKNAYRIKTDLSPIFIIGSPRSGTTLLYQLLTSTFKSIYFTNLMAIAPCLMSEMSFFLKFRRLEHWNMKNPKNYYGYVTGFNSPNEAGKILNRWFDVNKEFKKLSRNSILNLSKMHNLPFIIKNLPIVNKLDIVNQFFPEARYIYLKRDVFSTAYSIMNSRRKLFGNSNSWFGTKPTGFEKIQNESPYYQILWQIKKIDEIIHLFLADSKKFNIKLAYEDLCENPQAVLKNIQNAFFLKAAKEVQYQYFNYKTIKDIPLNDLESIISNYRALDGQITQY